MQHVNEPPGERDENMARELMDRAFACLDRHDLNGATEAARQLAAMRHSGTFEIMSEVMLASGNVKQAIEILEDGVKNAPAVWLLWQSLGNARTQNGEFARAQQAYDRALACPGVDDSSIHFNRGMAFARQRDFGHALEAFERVTSPQLRTKAASFKLAVCNDVHRFDEALSQGNLLLDEEAAEAEDRARIHAQVARACLQGYDDLEKARQHAEEAQRIWPDEPTARFVLRGIEAVRARRADNAVDC